MRQAVRRFGGGMLIVGALTAQPLTRLSAQVSFSAIIGARYTSTLVHDSIVVPFDVRPAIGPAVAIGVSERTQGAWTPSAAVDVSWASLQRHESGGSVKINSVTTLAFTVGLRRAVTPQLGIRVGVGALKYFPSDRSGLFRSGLGIAALGMIGVDWTFPAAAARGLGLSLRYDAHRFTTAALKTEGFTSPRLVNRVALGIKTRIPGLP